MPTESSSLSNCRKAFHVQPGDLRELLEGSRMDRNRMSRLVPPRQVSVELRSEVAPTEERTFTS